MKIVKFVFPPLDNNVYVVFDKGEGVVIDIALGSEAVASFAKKHNIQILYLINTHAHIDHTAHNSKLKNLLNVRIALHKNDYPLLKEFFRTKYDFIHEELEFAEPDILFDDGYVFKFGEVEMKVIHTPGHTPGSVCLYVEKEKVLFSGDTLFANTYGRTDFPYSSEEEMIKSLKKLSMLPGDVKVYPGHYEETKIGYETWLKEL
ncbi:MAG: MBL fold metallo-hydrolase [Thermoproteota archaeon]|jgi:Zn-dependent hydrolases, including glyoxylases